MALKIIQDAKGKPIDVEFGTEDIINLMTGTKFQRELKVLKAFFDLLEMGQKENFAKLPCSENDKADLLKNYMKICRSRMKIRLKEQITPSTVDLFYEVNSYD